MELEAFEILLVDDDDVDIEGVIRGLKKHDIRNKVTVARDGIEALEILRGEGESKKLPWPNLVLLDLKMPRMDGLECLEEIRKDPTLHNTIVFVLTTSANESDKLKADKLNVSGYLVKSEVGDGFEKLVDMLEGFWDIVRNPSVQPS